MRQTEERLIEVGFRRSPTEICDEIESASASMIRSGWNLKDALMEESLGFVHLFFEREIIVDIDHPAP